MKILFSYSENTFDLINYAELDQLKTNCNAMVDIEYKPVYIDVSNAVVDNPYIIINVSDLLINTTLAEYRKRNTITIYDDQLNTYYIGKISTHEYVNNTTLRIHFSLLPIQTNYLNGISRFYDCLFTKSPRKPTYTNNLNQQIAGETVVSVKYSNAVDTVLAQYTANPYIMVVIDKDLTPIGLNNYSTDILIPSGEILIDNPLPACSSRVGGATVSGFVIFFSNDSAMQAFFNSCYASNIKVECPLFTSSGDYQIAKQVQGAVANPLLGVAKESDLIATALTRGAAVLDATKVGKYYIPETINGGNVILCKEIPFQLTGEREIIEEGADIPVVINSEAYFNTADILQVKLCASTGQSFVIDSSNILLNDGVPEAGFNCKVAISLSGMDLLIGNSAYNLNLCKFPEYSYSSHSFESITNVQARSGVVNSTWEATKNAGSNLADWAVSLFKDDNFSTGDSGKSYVNTALDKTSVLGAINASSWTAARFHVELTYLPSPVRERLNKVYNRFGYEDYRFENIDINNITEKGYYICSGVQEVKNNIAVDEATFINETFSNGIINQLLSGIYVK